MGLWALQIIGESRVEHLYSLPACVGSSCQI